MRKVTAGNVGAIAQVDLTPITAPIVAPAAKRPDAVRGREDAFGGGAATQSIAPQPVAPSIVSRVVELPAGYPKSVDLGALALAARDILSGQGMTAADFAGTKKLVLTDADLTLFDSPVIPVFLRHKTTKQLLIDPATSAPLRLGIGAHRDVKKEYDAFRLQNPTFVGADYAPENAQVSHLANILAAKEILPTIQSLKKANADDTSREIVVTARGGDDSVIAGMKELLGRYGAKLDGALMMYHPEHKSKLGLDGCEGQGRKKALSMAALLTLFDPSATTLKRVKFVDDNDENLIRAMELLPKLFPDIRFEFIDVIHQGDGKFEPKLIARSTKGGGVKDAAGKKLDPSTYASIDAPLPPAIVQDGT